MLVDAGAGDEDGTANGVIVDPLGVAVETTPSSSATADGAALATDGVSRGGGGGGCFIASGVNPLPLVGGGLRMSAGLTALLVLIAAAGAVARQGTEPQAD